MHIIKLIAKSKNLGDDWIKAAGHEGSRSKKCRPFLQHVNEVIASVHKAGISTAAFAKKKTVFLKISVND